jgi:transglutaminase-like putative cysteine protease
VPVEPGLVLLTAAGAGLAALAVDTLAVTYRSAALAGLPLLALYAVPVAVVRDGVPGLLFVLAGLGWLALLLAEGRERVSGWGRLLRPRVATATLPTATQPSTTPTGAALGAVGRRVGAAALGLAVVVPALVPGLEEGVLRRGGGGEGGDGGGGLVVTINPFVGLRGELAAPSPAEVLRYRLERGSPDYLRMVTLDTFDGTYWVPASLTSDRQATAALPDPPGLGPDVDRQETQLSFRMTALDSTWLPLPYPTTQVRDLEGSWFHDDDTGNVFSPRRRSVGTTYTAEGLLVRPTEAQLRAAAPADDPALDAYRQLPDDLPAVVASTAREVTAAATTDFDRALALQRFFRDPNNGFRYQLDVPAFDGPALVGFLENRAGFCQQFSGAFAALARSVGLPTRVQVGFTPGSRQLGGDEFVVRQSNTHAWPEVYFAGVGWVRFEPTPGGAGIDLPGYTLTPGGTDGSPTPSASASAPTAAPSQGPQDGRPTADDTDLGGGGWSALPWTTLALLAGGVGLLLAPALTRAATRRRRLRLAEAATPAGMRAGWRELADTCADLGAPWPGAETPRATAARVADGLPDDARTATGRLGHGVERVRYAATPGDLGDVAGDVRAVLAALTERAGRRSRWRARLAPASVLSRVGTRVADGLDWVDSLGGRLRAVGTRALRRPRRA